MMLLLAIAVLVIAMLAGLGAVELARRRTRRFHPPALQLPGESAPAATAAAPRPSVALVVRRAPRPVVLVHGILGFDQLGVAGARIEYFRGVARDLAARDVTTYAVRLPPLASVPARARALADAVAALPHDRVDLIAHSLGGLDARWALSRLGLASRVASLVTIATPHRGTPLADLAVGGPLDWARRLVASVGMPLDALSWLTTDALERFNREVPDAPGVRYACVVGAATRLRTPLPLLAMSHAYLRRVAGANDGLVPAASQAWGETLAEIDADHFAQIGWELSLRARFDALGLYGRVIEALALPPPTPALLPARGRRLSSCDG
jgi:triacylglycerol lipase